MFSSRRRGLLALAGALVFALSSTQPSPGFAEDKLLAEAVEMTGTMLFLQTRVPAFVIGAIRNDETVVYGFGKITPDRDQAPDGDTILRIGSISKAFTGAVLASLVADGSVKLTDRLQDHLTWDVAVPEAEGKPIRLIELATHSSGLPREVDRAPGPPEDPFRTLTKDAYIAGLKSNPLLFPPGTGILYSNFAFDLLGAALSEAAGRPYGELLRERVLDPAGLKDTTISLRDADRNRVMQGHDFDGKPLPLVTTPEVMAGASSLYSTPNDMLRWLRWHLDRFSPQDAEMRLLDHAIYLPREGMSPAYGLDEAGHGDAMGLGWVVMRPADGRPLILQKSGGLQGTFSYIAFAPQHGIGVFVAINSFDIGAIEAISGAVNELIGQMAPD